MRVLGSVCLCVILGVVKLLPCDWADEDSFAPSLEDSSITPAWTPSWPDALPAPDGLKVPFTLFTGCCSWSPLKMASRLWLRSRESFRIFRYRSLSLVISPRVLMISEDTSLSLRLKSSTSCNCSSLLSSRSCENWARFRPCCPSCERKASIRRLTLLLLCNTLWLMSPRLEGVNGTPARGVSYNTERGLMSMVALSRLLRLLLGIYTGGRLQTLSQLSLPWEASWLLYSRKMPFHLHPTSVHWTFFLPSQVSSLRYGL